MAPHIWGSPDFYENGCKPLVYNRFEGVKKKLRERSAPCFWSFSTREDAEAFLLVLF
jgi:hypothetical protein